MSKERDTKLPDTSSFKLATDSAFGSRVDDIFSNLGHIEAKHNAYQKARSRSRDGRDDDKLMKEDPGDDSYSGRDKHHDDSESRPSRSSHHQEISDHHHSSSDHSRGFKRPRNPPPRPRRRADHELHPEKYTYYNLEHVTAKHMSEKSNTAAALDFLNSLDSSGPEKKLKMDHQQDEMEVHDGEETAKILFSKPRKNTDEIKDGNSSIQIAGRSGCVVMPEYTIGQKPVSKKAVTRKNVTSEEKALVSISHLQDEDGVDDEPEELTPKPTRTVFSGCIADDNEPMDIEPGSRSKNNTKSFKKRTMRSNRHSDGDDDDDDEPACTLSTDIMSYNAAADLDAVD